MKKVLVTGGTGFIGSNLVKRLLNDNVEVYVLIRPNSTSGMRRLESLSGIKFIQSTPKELKSNKLLPKFDVCFNLAAYGVKYEEQNMDEMINGNVNFLIDIIDFVCENKTNLLIHTGSCFEYGVNEGEKLTEESRLEPQSIYASTKLSGTIIGTTYAKLKNVNMITVRPFGVYGPGEAEYRLLPQLIEAAIKKKELRMTPGEQVRDYLYIDDLVDAYLKLSNSGKIKPYDIYNICSAQPILIKEFVEVFCSVYKCRKDIFKLGEIPYRENEVMHFIGDNSKIKEQTYWEPRISLEEGIKLSIDLYNK
ncbi:MAG: NAD(P)-dependent oxidoreductase [Clostridium beijerinckii]|jgi:nucleoside-diphosphate-sugar epimerase|nr:NAD(P)-dependent oxidoreductase [Clostridium beijerinckii]MCI1577499.1 NAD(P)-dependent oxidoreductase [Clostridium beijerinckii]MCI1583272.1 NAD(P)-dependent oxidoreductase [Clostridium beijerinckii]MCI1621172.1 NAD(P)-dependent oxidoreductase [Clostridium beijerinckii]